MKSVCKYCGNHGIINWGGRRKYCVPCNRTFSVLKAGRNRSKKTVMYLLDRSTFRRIGFKIHRGHTTVIRGLHRELVHVSTPVNWLKKISAKPRDCLLLTPSIYRLREKTIMNIWPLILTLA